MSSGFRKLAGGDAAIADAMLALYQLRIKPEIGKTVREITKAQLTETMRELVREELKRALTNAGKNL